MATAVVRTIEDLHALESRNGSGRALVPTMGALHAGHAALIRRAREIAGRDGQVLVSIFVNPAQFAPHEDFTQYPRQLDQDLAMCKEAGADVVFAPGVSEMYPAGEEIVADGFSTPALPDVATRPRLEDAFRPTHFAGVCKVVARLFDIAQPAQALFGEKDYQQLRVITELVREQQPRWPDLEIVACATVREADGLAMSSRNAYLKPTERDRALSLWNALNEARARGPAAAEPAMRAALEAHELTVDYAVVRDARTLLSPTPGSRAVRALIAARLGDVRLIDNMSILQEA